MTVFRWYSDDIKLVTIQTTQITPGLVTLKATRNAYYGSTNQTKIVRIETELSFFSLFLSFFSF